MVLSLREAHLKPGFLEYGFLVNLRVAFEQIAGRTPGVKLIRGTLQKLQGPVFRGLHFALVVTLGGFDMMCYIALSCCWVLILVFVNNPPYVMIPHMS